MKRLLFLLLTFSLACMARAQFCPVNSTWHFGVPSNNSTNFEDLIYYKALKDSLIENEVYSFIQGYDRNNLPLKEYALLISKKNDSVFYYYDNVRWLYFVENVSVGDTLTVDLHPYVIPGMFPEPYKVIIDSILMNKKNAFQEDSLKTYYFHSQRHSDRVGLYTEKVIVTILTDFLLGLFPDANLLIKQPYLRCYSDTGFQFKLKDFSRPCDYFGTGIESATLLKYAVYPNPSNNTLFISSDDISSQIEIKIVNSLGQIIVPFYERRLNTIAVDISSLLPNQYHLIISDKDAVSSMRFVKN